MTALARARLSPESLIDSYRPSASHRTSPVPVLIEDLADEHVAPPPPPFPAALYDAILPPRIPSGRPIARTQHVRSINEIAAYVAHGRVVHVTMTGVPGSKDPRGISPVTPPRASGYHGGDGEGGVGGQVERRRGDTAGDDLRAEGGDHRAVVGA